eukprot:CAMPEP_0184319786 /NCGR_PEP_ID=MMETSP1049-20130417/110560_1 /TAXON_ID=77928 /ORGANISM="Proteomonas sulcata, Strain CCMP704" /LENGTH=54 /DNA_ID=CAMNT_0026640083 /DNA_START=529 /DNA_END=693 /DNA_ORIENTATION=+
MPLPADPSVQGDSETVARDVSRNKVDQRGSGFRLESTDDDVPGGLASSGARFVL